MKWVLFDYGEVLSHAQPEDDRARLVAVCDTDPDGFWRGYWEHRLEFDRGTLSPDAYWSRVIGRRASAGEVERLVALDVRSWSHANWDTVAILSELLAAGRPVALLSNAPVCVADGVERLPHVQAMRARFYSGHLGLVKPEREIYLRAAAELGASPGDVVFVDDRPVNVGAAESVGMSAIHFRDAGTLRADLESVMDGPH